MRPSAEWYTVLEAMWIPRGGNGMTKLVKAGVAAAALAVATLAGPDLAAAQMQDKTLRASNWGLPPSRGNPFAGFSTPQTFTWSAMFDALTAIDETGKPQAALATAWKNTSPTTWEFTLRPGVKFHNGEALTPAALIEAVNWLNTDDGKAKGGSVGSRIAWIASMAPKGDGVVEITTKRPNPIAPNELAVLLLPEPKAWKDLTAFADKPVGTGSYKAVSFSQNLVKFEADPQSWRPAKIGHLEIYDIPDRAARLAAFQSGQVDIALGMSPDNLPALKASGAQINAQTGHQVLTFGITQINAKEGVNVAPFQDKRVRLALNHAVDRQAMVDGLLGGVGGIAAGQGLTPIVNGYNPNVKPYAHDPAKARALLAEAGHGNLAFDVEAIPGAFPADSEVFQQMAADLGKAGVKTNIKTITFADWRNKFFPMTWDVPVWHNLWIGGPVMDASSPMVSQSCGKSGKPYICDPKQQALLDASSSEFDEKKRTAILQQLVQVQHDEAINIFLIGFNNIHAYSAKVDGFRNINETIHYHLMTLKP